MQQQQAAFRYNFSHTSINTNKNFRMLRKARLLVRMFVQPHCINAFPHDMNWLPVFNWESARNNLRREPQLLQQFFFKNWHLETQTKPCFYQSTLSISFWILIPKIGTAASYFSASCSPTQFVLFISTRSYTCDTTNIPLHVIAYMISIC